jgi:phosphopantetheine--protein transferase-like protein
MKRNPGTTGHKVLPILPISLTWLVAPDAGILIAAFTDDGRLDESAALSSLSEAERDQAMAKTVPSERRHYVYRRCFQRVFAAEVTGWQHALSDLQLLHRLDHRPQLACHPGLVLSFSSSGATALACASKTRDVGIDIESLRTIADAARLSARFFSPPEAELVARALPEERDRLFLRLWTAKEAGLKAVGEGIETGLNRFTISPENERYRVEIEKKFENQPGWRLDYLDGLPGHIVALVHRPAGIPPKR